MNRNMIKWLLCVVCVFVLVGEVLGCPPPAEPPTARINGYNESHEFDATGVEMLFVSNSGDENGWLVDHKWQFPAGVTPSADSSVDCQSCGTGCLEDVFVVWPCTKTRCTFSSTGKQTITLKVTDNDGLTDTATCDVYISDVVSVEWVKIFPSNLDIDDHPAVPANGGKRIFPGKITDGDEYALLWAG